VFCRGCVGEQYLSTIINIIGACTINASIYKILCAAAMKSTLHEMKLINMSGHNLDHESKYYIMNLELWYMRETCVTTFQFLLNSVRKLTVHLHRNLPRRFMHRYLNYKCCIHFRNIYRIFLSGDLLKSERSKGNI
jgi:hypothetical protein